MKTDRKVAQPYIDNLNAWIAAEAADGKDTIVMSAKYAQELIDLLSALSVQPAREG